VRFGVHIFLTSFLVAVFSGAAFVHLWGPKTLRAAYARWGYTSKHRYAAALANFVAALLLAYPTTQMAGAVLGALMLFVAIVTLLDHSEYIRAALRLGVLAALWFQVLSSA